MKVAETKAEAKAEAELVKELTGQIIARAEANKWTRAALAQRAGKKSAVTLYGWRNGTRKNPALLDLQAFARAVGLNVRLVDDSASTDSSGTQVHVRGGTDLRPETQDVVRVMEGASDELRATIKERVLALITERASLPLEPGEESKRSPSTRRR